jgi:hypothetical protein
VADGWAGPKLDSPRADFLGSARSIRNSGADARSIGQREKRLNKQLKMKRNSKKKNKSFLLFL